MKMRCVCVVGVYFAVHMSCVCVCSDCRACMAQLLGGLPSSIPPGKSSPHPPTLNPLNPHSTPISHTQAFTPLTGSALRPCRQVLCSRRLPCPLQPRSI